MIERGQELPKWAQDVPELNRDSEFYLSAFYELHTTRFHSNPIGPIPWTAQLEYAKFAGLDQVNTKAFLFIIRELDNVFIPWYEKTLNRKQGNHNADGPAQHSNKNRPDAGSQSHQKNRGWLKKS